MARWGNSAYECRGPLFQLAGQLHGILADDSDDSILFCILNGVNMPQVEVMDGLFMAIAKDGPQTPGAATCLLERECNLTGDTADDDRRYEEIKSSAFLWDRAHRERLEGRKSRRRRGAAVDSLPSRRCATLGRE